MIYSNVAEMLGGQNEVTTLTELVKAVNTTAISLAEYLVVYDVNTDLFTFKYPFAKINPNNTTLVSQFNTNYELHWTGLDRNGDFEHTYKMYLADGEVNKKIVSTIPNDGAYWDDYIFNKTAAVVPEKISTKNGILFLEFSAPLVEPFVILMPDGSTFMASVDATDVASVKYGFTYLKGRDLHVIMSCTQR